MTFKESSTKDPVASVQRELANNTPTLAAGGHNDAATATPTRLAFSPLIIRIPAASPLMMAKTMSPTPG